MVHTPIFCAANLATGLGDEAGCCTLQQRLSARVYVYLTGFETKTWRGLLQRGFYTLQCTKNLVQQLRK